MSDDYEDEDESTCQKPCHPNSNCEYCTEYWQRMIREGYWDAERGRWTEKGWNSITRSF